MKCTSRCVTRTSALVPENPVRYRTFGRLLRTSASMCAAVRASLSAAMRVGRRSAMSHHRQTFYQPTQRELVAVRSKTADHGDGRVGERRATAVRLARKDVRQMHFDERNLHASERVTNCETGVAVRLR